MSVSQATCNVCGLALLSSSVACPRCWGDPTRTWVLEDSAAPQTVARTGEPPASKPLALDPDERYEVLDTLGRGGMGLVYKVRDRELDEIIAVKVLRAEYDSSELAVERFKQEIKLARRINHPNVARLFDLFLWRGHLAISQEYIPGLDLAQVLDAGPLPLARILRYLRYLCSALLAAHDLGVVHRDLKPRNIRVDRDDRPRILDFGLAVLAGRSRQSAKGLILGTPAFMAPEQAFSPQDVDHRADIYSLGVVVFRMATGQLPFEGREPSEILRAHSSKPPPRPRSVVPDLPLIMEDVILRCLQKDPARRYASARDVYEHAAQTLESDETHHARGALPPIVVEGKSRGKVLVVDDDEVTRLLARTQFEALGLVVVEAADGQAGVEAALREEPGFILLDINMPGLDGRDALRILKANPRTQTIPVVMLTGLDYKDEAVFAREAGASTFLNKPIQPDVLELLADKYCR